MDTNALSFYVTETVLVRPKWFYSDQIDLDLTIMIWSRPKWIGQVQIVIFKSRKLDMRNLQEQVKKAFCNIFVSFREYFQVEKWPDFRSMQFPLKMRHFEKWAV